MTLNEMSAIEADMDAIIAENLPAWKDLACDQAFDADSTAI